MKRAVCALLFLSSVAIAQTAEEVEQEILRTVAVTKKIRNTNYKNQMIELTKDNYTRLLEGNIETAEILASQKRYTQLATEWVKNETGRTRNVARVASRVTSVPSSIVSQIKKRAVKEWPGDFAMQKHEIERQKKGYLGVANYSASIPKNVLSEIIKNAKKEWSGDFAMQKHEMDRQVKGYRDVINYKVSGIPSAVLKQIKEKAVREWPGDFAMQKHEMDRQVKGYRSLN